MFKILLIFAAIAFVVADQDQAVRDDREVLPNGFKIAQELPNGAKSDQSQDEHGNQVGKFEWISPEGEHVALSYVADEHGYQPKSDLLPTPPPIPVEIQRAIEWIAAHGSSEKN